MKLRQKIVEEADDDLEALAALHQNRINRNKILTAVGGTPGASPSPGSPGSAGSSGSPERRVIMLEKVDLKKMGLSDLNRFEFRNCRHLDVSHNRLEKLPLLDLPMLTHVDVSHNLLTTTKGLFLCQLLAEAHFQHNQITRVAQMETLEDLHFLDLSENKIETLDGIKSLAYNAQLTVLLLKGNPVVANRDKKYWLEIANVIGSRKLEFVDGHKLSCKGKMFTEKQSEVRKQSWKRPFFFDLEKSSAFTLGDPGLKNHVGWENNRQEYTSGTRERPPPPYAASRKVRGSFKRDPASPYRVKHEDPVIDAENARLEVVYGKEKGGKKWIRSVIAAYRNMDVATRKAWVDKHFRNKKRGLTQGERDKLAKRHKDKPQVQRVLPGDDNSEEKLKNWIDGLRKKSVVEHHTTSFS
ncbi:unnamed protein product [Amoebophrya sp. A25]|nr:unnamed protein product [Amoebophrya sp. A25]|eukprot:GSA25T00008522001.1